MPKVVSGPLSLARRLWHGIGRDFRPPDGGSSEITSVKDQMGNLLRRDEFLRVMNTVNDEISQLSAEVGQMRRGLAKLREAYQRSVAHPSESPTVSLPLSLPEEPANAVEGDMVAPATVPLEREAVPIEDLILSRFDEVDYESRRNFPVFKSIFVDLLKGRVADIQELDDAVLFFKSADTALVCPWTNARLGRTWFSHFNLTKGVNFPVLRVESLALVRRTEDGSWITLQRGNARNDN